MYTTSPALFDPPARRIASIKPARPSSTGAAATAAGGRALETESTNKNVLNQNLGQNSLCILV